MLNLDKKLIQCEENGKQIISGIVGAGQMGRGMVSQMVMMKGIKPGIVSDIMMPRVDGYELVQTLRDSGSSVPVLMITAKDRFQDMQLGFLSRTPRGRCVTSLAYDHLHIPYDGQTHFEL